MGTRSVTQVVNPEGESYVALYGQYDGYPNGGHGEDLADFLADSVIVNGIRFGEERHIFNGAGDLAARLVAFFKKDWQEVGSYYLTPNDRDWGVDYSYIITVKDAGWNDEGSISIEVKSFSRQLFEGSVEEFQVFVSQDEEEEDY